MMKFGQSVGHFFLPYCIQPLSDGRSLLLNRNYKPLGQLTNDWVDYEQAPSAIRLVGLGTAAAGRLDPVYVRPPDGLLFLYDDSIYGGDPEGHRRDYLKRLGVLMDLKIKSTVPRRGIK